MSDEQKPQQGKMTFMVSFETVDDLYARLMIKLRNEEMTKREFFTGIINAYLQDEKNIREFLREYRKGKGYAKWKEELLDKEAEDAKVEMRKFGLDQEEIDDIYDLFDDEAGL